MYVINLYNFGRFQEGYLTEEEHSFYLRELTKLEGFSLSVGSQMLVLDIIDKVQAGAKNAAFKKA
ncbi:hypothetical protein Lbir_1782 [Legionella birminghamensis]|uniref:Uncharacterized protein n=1 Tax=Legionella birminghamensis TaxID=28083 RepID=A0A378I5V8_9GAMM|nr:hypothetical protein [Legionella birminghamensis]KTC70199.1 hypothetical protein Lbir_1782 [Legionella birminghamensis]STX30393.1 Uncharacterised protein [Legionella birminghamensis]